MLARNIYTIMQLVIHSKIYASTLLDISFAILCFNTACFPCLVHHTHIHTHTNTHTYIPASSFQTTGKRSVPAAHILMRLSHISINFRLTCVLRAYFFFP